MDDQGGEYLATHDLKQRGWTAALIRDFLGRHDATRPNRMRLGSRRRLPPVKLYLTERVDEAERAEEFLVAQARAMEARDRAERALETRRANIEAQVDAFVRAWTPSITPKPVRRGAHRKAFAAHEDELRAAEARLSAALPGLPKRALRDAAERLAEKYVQALRSAYPWLQADG